MSNDFEIFKGNHMQPSRLNPPQTNELFLVDFVNTKILNTIQDKFTQVTGVHCVIADTEGRPLTKIDTFTRFCKLIRSLPEGKKRCEECDRIKSMEAARKGEAIFYKCHAGLIDAAMPIVLNNNHMGNFLCGQVVLQGDELDYDDIKNRVRDLNIDERLLRPYLEEVEVVTQEKLITALEMMALMTNYIVEMGAANIIQKQLMTEMKAKAELENMLKEAEYKALLAQINPHFLFNCLNTIGRVALTEGAYKTQELIYSISDILRSLLKHTDRIIPLEEELKYVNDYLAIQKARFEDRISTVYEVCDDVRDAALPKFTIQPLVENAIVHGLEPQKEGGVLTIKANKCDNNIVIEVTDTGVGIPESKIEALRQFGQGSYPGEKFKSLGLINVHQRIQHYFGQQYGLKLNCPPNQGCRVTVTLPFITKD